MQHTWRVSSCRVSVEIAVSRTCHCCRSDDSPRHAYSRLRGRHVYTTSLYITDISRVQALHVCQSHSLTRNVSFILRMMLVPLYLGERHFKLCSPQADLAAHPATLRLSPLLQMSNASPSEHTNRQSDGAHQACFTETWTR